MFLVQVRFDHVRVRLVHFMFKLGGFFKALELDGFYSLSIWRGGLRWA